MRTTHRVEGSFPIIRCGGACPIGFAWEIPFIVFEIEGKEVIWHSDKIDAVGYVYDGGLRGKRARLIANIANEPDKWGRVTVKRVYSIQLEGVTL